MTAKNPDPRNNGLLYGIFGLQRHEYYAVAWSFSYFFCVMSSYFMMRPMREAMGVQSGVATIPVLFSSTFAVMLLLAPLFGWIASKFPRRTFLPWVYVFFAGNIFLFYGVFSYAINNDVDSVWIGRVFFVWLSVFNLFVVSVFWSFMADIFTREQGRRLFGFISAGGSCGALAGPFLTSLLAVPLGFQNLLPLAGSLLLLSILCIHKLQHWPQGEATTEQTTDTALGGSPFAGVTHVSRSRFLSAIAGKQVLASLLGTALYMFMAHLVGEAVEGTDQRTRLFGIIDGSTSAFALLFQLLAVKHSVRKLGVGITLALMPLCSLAGFALLAINPGILGVAVFQAVRRAIGFGFEKPTTDMLYSVVSTEEKYKSKNFIETAFYRGSDLLGTWSVKLMWGLGLSGISIIMLPFAALWSGVAIWLGREYTRRDQQQNQQQEQNHAQQ